MTECLSAYNVVGGFMKTEILKDRRTDSRELYNPYFWENDDIMASVLLEPYWLDKASKESMKDGNKFDLLEFASIHDAKVVLRITTPEESKEIDFPFVRFTSVFEKPSETLAIFERAVKQYLNSVNHPNVEIKHGKRETIIRNFYKNNR